MCEGSFACFFAPIYLGNKGCNLPFWAVFPLSVTSHTSRGWQHDKLIVWVQATWQ